MISSDLVTLAAELRRQSKDVPLTRRRVGLDADQVHMLAERVEGINMVEAGRLRRAAARLKGFAVATPYRSPTAEILLDVAGELEAVKVKLSFRGRPAGFGGDVA